MSDFRKKVLRLTDTKIHKVRNSYGVYDGFKYYRTHRPNEHKYVLTESQYFSIIRKVNDLLRESLINGEEITFPHRLGRLEVRKHTAKMSLKNGKLKTNLPVDWDKTLKLWAEDEESYKNKALVRAEEKEVYRVFYNRVVADFTNKSFYQFNANRELKRQLKRTIKEGKLDAFMI